MKTRKLGKQGPDISVIGYGAWEIGGQAYGPNPDEAVIMDAVHAALDAGINWIDTAEIYGKGNSETLIGRAVTGHRDEVIIASKVAPKPFGTGFAPEEVKLALKQSLGRLRTDHLDLYQLHWVPEDNWDIDDTWGAMTELADEGVVRFIGVSNFDQLQIERCLAIRHCDSLQPQYSLLHREGEDLFRWCGEQGIGVIVYGPMAYGLLSGKIGLDTIFDETDWRSGKDPTHSYYVDLFKPGRFEGHVEIVAELQTLAKDLGLSVGQLALAWAFHKPGVTAAITGSRNPKHNRENAAAALVELSEDDMRAIEKLL